MKKRPFTILNISDLHIGGSDPNVATYLETLAKELTGFAGTEWQPDYIVIAGDVIDCVTPGTPEDKYRLARRVIDTFLRRLDLGLERVIVVPGNHDNELSGKDFEGRKANLNKMCIAFSEEALSEFIEKQEPAFRSFVDFRKCYATDDEIPVEYLTGNPLSLVSGLSVFPDHRLCFLRINTEWLYTRSKIDYEHNQHGTLCRPFVKSLADVLERDFPDFTVVTIMHKRPDTLLWPLANHTDPLLFDALEIVEGHSDIIVSGHDHAVRANFPELLRGGVLPSFRLGSPTVSSKDLNRRFPHSVSLLRVDPVALRVDMKCGNDISGKWIFKEEGTFPLRNKYELPALSSTELAQRIAAKGDEILRLKARSSELDDVRSAISDRYNDKNNVRRINAICVDNHPVDSSAWKSGEEHVALYTLIDDQPHIEILTDKYREVCESLHRARALRQVVVSRLIVQCPRFPGD